MVVEVEVSEAGVESGHSLVTAWAGNRPVGRLELRWRGSRHDHILRCIGRVPEISRMWVAEQFRGQGIAGEMLATAKQLARRRGAARVGLAVAIDNHPALAAYEKAEFSRIGLPRFESPFGPNGAHTVIYLTASTAAEEPESSRATA